MRVLDRSFPRTPEYPETRPNTVRNVSEAVVPATNNMVVEDSYMPMEPKPKKSVGKKLSDWWEKNNLKFLRTVLMSTLGATPGIGALANGAAIGDHYAGGPAIVGTAANVIGTAALVGGAMHYALPALAISGLHYLIVDNTLGHH